MIEIKVSIEEDVLDKETNLTTTIGTEETFALPDKFNAVDKFTLIRGVRDFLENAISQAELRQQKRDVDDIKKRS